MSRPLHIVLLSVFGVACSSGGPGPSDPDPLEIVTADLPDGAVGATYAAVVQARGGQPPYEFVRGGGALPDGLSLAADGRIFGTPSAEGPFSIELVARDGQGSRARRTLGLLVGPGEPLPLRFVTEALSPGDVGEPYTAALEAEGGVPPYTWSVVDGQLPEGLVFDPVSASITGTPAALGDHFVTFALEDASEGHVERTLALVIAPAPVLLTELFPIAVVGEPYRAQLEVTGGAWPLTFEANSGDLPEGLTMHPSGLVAGTPRVPISRPIRFRVTDAAGVIRDQRIRIWVVEEQHWEAWSDVEIPPSCGLLEPVVVRGTLNVDDPAMIARVEVAVDLLYADVEQLDLDVVAPDGTRVPIQVGGQGGAGPLSIHFMYGRVRVPWVDAVSWGSFAPLVGLAPRGVWSVEVRVLPTSFRCVDLPGRLQRIAIVIDAETSSADYLRSSGYGTNNLIEGPFARITGGGLEQDTFDLVFEQWSTGADGIPEGGTGDDVLLGAPGLIWMTDLGPEIGAIDAGGHFQAGSTTGQGILTGTAGELSIELPVKVVAPDWVP